MNITIEHVHSLRLGDERALNFIYGELIKPMLIYAKDLTDDDQQAEDIVGEAFFKLWTKRQTFDEVSRIRAFLFTVIRNAALNYIKLQKRTQANIKKLSETTSLYTDEHDIQAQIGIFDSELYAKVIDEIEQLGGNRKKVMKMFYFDRKPIAEIASELNIKPGNVSTIKDETLKKIKNKLLPPKSNKSLLKILLFIRFCALLLTGSYSLFIVFKKIVSFFP